MKKEEILAHDIITEVWHTAELLRMLEKHKKITSEERQEGIGYLVKIEDLIKDYVDKI